MICKKVVIFNQSLIPNLYDLQPITSHLPPKKCLKISHFD